MKEGRIHNFCTESEPLKDKWVRLLQQAQVERLLRPHRSSSMMRPRCNSIPDLEPPDTPTSPPGTPSSTASSSSPTAWSSPPNTPTSPLKFGSPKFQKATAQNSVMNSPKFQKAFPKGPNSPKIKEFLDPPAWVKGKVIASSALFSDTVKLKAIRHLSEKAASEQSGIDPLEMSEQAYVIRENSVFYIPSPHIPAAKKPSNIKSSVMAMKSNKLPVTRVNMGPITSLVSGSKNKHNRFLEQQDSAPNLTRLAVTRATSQHSVVSRAYTTGSRPVSGPGYLVRARPVSGERPIIEPRASTYRLSSHSTSSESESEHSGSSRKLKRLSGNDSDRSFKSDAIPSKSPSSGVVLRRKLATTKSMPLLCKNIESSSDSEPDDENQKPQNGNDQDYSDDVFTAAPAAASSPTSAAASSPVLRYTLRVRDDEYYETLCEVLRKPRPPIPILPYPRLELTFRSAFDDIRLFLANNRRCDEIFPVPRLSERGGKAIKNLQRVLKMLS